MIRFSFIIMLALHLVALNQCTGQSDQKSKLNKQEVTSKTDELVQKYIDLGIYSGVVLIAEKGVPIYHRSFGMADRENSVSNTTNTLFDIGSMNKTFTSVVVKQLISEGKLNYSDKLIDFIDGFRDPMVSKVTVEHLLNHESGFGDYHSSAYFELSIKERSLHKIVERLKSVQLMFTPGEGNEYSNAGYILLGAIIEEASGKSYFENVKERIIEPLDLKNTHIEDLERYRDQVAYGYLYTPLGILEKNNSMQDLPNPDGGFLSTTEDILRFYRSYYYDNILLNKKIKSNDPFFQWLTNSQVGNEPMTAGGFPGFNTAFYQNMKEDVSIIVFANMDEPVAEYLAQGIIQITKDQTPSEPKLPAIQNVRKAFEEKGVHFIKQNFDDLTSNFHPADPKDWILNSLGYAYLMEKNDVDSAIKLFKLNTELFPDIGNCWDSYGEALRKNGEKAEALKAYKKALEINPNIPSAKRAVIELKK